MTTSRFPIRFSGGFKAMAVIGMLPSNSDLSIEDDHLRVRMGWTFTVTVPRASVRHVAEDHGRVWGWGVHGWRGEWLVNGSSAGLVRIEIDPPVRARLLLILPVKVRVLRVSLQDPAAVIAALA